MQQIRQLEGNSPVGTLSVTKDLKELAALSGGLKALNTFLSFEGQGAVRQCCGGNGYLLNSTVARMYADSAWTVTAEGDYIIMLLFSAKFLLKMMMDTMLKRKEHTGSVEYLNELLKPGITSEKDLCPVAKSHLDFLNPKFLQSLFRFRALKNVGMMAKQVQKEMGEHSQQEALDNSALFLLAAAKAHLHLMNVNAFYNYLDQEDTAIKTVLERLFCFHCVCNILDDNWTTVIDRDQILLARKVIPDLME